MARVLNNGSYWFLQNQSCIPKYVISPAVKYLPKVQEAAAQFGSFRR